MRARSVLCVLTAWMLCVPLFGCMPEELLDYKESSETVSDHKSQRFDIAELKAKAEQISKSWNADGQKDSMQSCIDELLDAVDEAYAAHVRAQIAYYADWNNDDLLALYNETTEDYYVADEIAAWTFTNGFRRSVYKELFEPYAALDNLTYYTVHNLSRVMAYARNEASSHSDLITEYYNLAYSEDTDIEKTNQHCAKIYLDILADYDVSESLFDYYNRDYTAEEASEIYHTVVGKLVPLRDHLKEQLESVDRELWNAPIDIDSYAMLKKYAPRLGERIAESSFKLFGESLYTEARGVNCYDGSFTVNLPGEQSALMYTYFSDVFYDFITVTHEFGHFHSDWRDTTPVYLQSMNYDIAEAQSQSMVTLFLPYYPDIFGDDATFYQLIVLYDLLDSVIAGFAVGEFEHEAMQRIDDISPSETAALFAEIMETCGVHMEFYQVTHLFEQPGYYISYGVSALPALEMYEMVTDNPQRAVSVYDKLSSYSCMQAEYGFREIMKICGFSDFFAEGALEHTAEVLTVHMGESVLKS